MRTDRDRRTGCVEWIRVTVLRCSIQHIDQTRRCVGRLWLPCQKVFHTYHPIGSRHMSVTPMTSWSPGTQTQSFVPERRTVRRPLSSMSATVASPMTQEGPASLARLFCVLPRVDGPLPRRTSHWCGRPRAVRANVVDVVGPINSCQPTHVASNRRGIAADGYHRSNRKRSAAQSQFITDQRHRKPVKNPRPAHIQEINRITDAAAAVRRRRLTGGGNLAVVRQSG